MRKTRRMRRMMRSKKKSPGLMLTSLMDVFTILVFFLLVNSSSSEVLDAPKQIKLPDSIVESKPRETVVILVTPETVLVQGEAVVSTPELLEAKTESVAPIAERLARVDRNVIGIRTQIAAENKEVTILADKTIPFRVLKRVMSTCTDSGFGKISLAVNQKASQS